jgi:hypothetical protein
VRTTVGAVNNMSFYRMEGCSNLVLESRLEISEHIVELLMAEGYVAMNRGVGTAHVACAKCRSFAPHIRRKAWPVSTLHTYFFLHTYFLACVCVCVCVQGEL